MSTRQLQDLTNAFSTLRSDVTKFQVKCSNLRADFFIITERLDSKLQAATAKIQQDNENLVKNLHKIYTMKFRNCLEIYVPCAMTLNISFKKSLEL